MNTVSDSISVYLVERNILVPANFGVPFQGVSGLQKKKIYIYIYIKFHILLLFILKKKHKSYFFIHL